jgi:hypothetical protein
MKKFLNKRRIINIDINKCLMKNSDFKRPSISLIKRRTERIQNKFLFSVCDTSAHFQHVKYMRLSFQYMKSIRLA